MSGFLNFLDRTFFGGVDAVLDAVFGKPEPPQKYSKAPAIPELQPIKVSYQIVTCPFCRTNVMFCETGKRMNIHGPGPMGQTVCPGSGPNPRWKSMQS